jgi:ribonuclease HI
LSAKWDYPEDKAFFAKPGSYTACIAGSGKATRSAAAWKVWPDDEGEPAVEGVRVSNGSSTAPRAALAAAARVLETLQPNSSVNIHCRQEYVVDLINVYRQKWAKDYQGRWINSAGKEASNADIIVRIDSIIESRRLNVKAHHCNDERSRYGIEIALLLNKAAEAIKSKRQRNPEETGVTPEDAPPLN